MAQDYAVTDYYYTIALRNENAQLYTIIVIYRSYNHRAF